MKHLKLYGKLARFTSMTVVMWAMYYVRKHTPLPTHAMWLLWGICTLVYSCAVTEMGAHYKPQLKERDEIIAELIDLLKEQPPSFQDKLRAVESDIPDYIKDALTD